MNENLKKALDLITNEKDEDKKKAMVEFALDYLGKQHAELFANAAGDARKEYMRNWRAKNREKIRNYEKKYWTKKAGGQFS